MNIEDAINYLRNNEEIVSVGLLDRLSEEVIIKLAQELMDKADNYYGGLN